MSNAPPPIPTLVSKIPAMLKARGISLRNFALSCQAAGGSYPTGYRLGHGLTNFHPHTLCLAAAVLGVSGISDLFEFEFDE